MLAGWFSKRSQSLSFQWKKTKKQNNNNKKTTTIEQADVNENSSDRAQEST